MSVLCSGVLERVCPFNRTGDLGSRWFAFMGEAGDGEEELPHLASVTSIRGISQLSEARIEPVLRRCDGKQP